MNSDKNMVDSLKAENEILKAKVQYLVDFEYNQRLDSCGCLTNLEPYLIFPNGERQWVTGYSEPEIQHED